MQGIGNHPSPIPDGFVDRFKERRVRNVALKAAIGLSCLALTLVGAETPPGR